MKRLMIARLAVLALLLSGTAHASQVCNETVTPYTPDSRFEVNDDEVTDLETGLVWQRCLVGQLWNSELSECRGDPTTTFWKAAMETATGEWRVPNIKELNSIMEHACNSPTINQNVFPIDIEAFTVWSSTPARRNLTQEPNDTIAVAQFQFGTSLQWGEKSRAYAVLLVKNAPPAVGQ